MLILAIETSCDETAVALVQDGRTILGHAISSQIKEHKLFGGVVPELASRLHAETVNLLIDRVCTESAVALHQIDAIAVTYGPGLEGALLVGLAAAKALAQLLNKPLIPINHMHGHIYANFLSGPLPLFPCICMVVSGGHTQLLQINDHFSFKLLGQTRDDAAGEAFDKVARVLGLGYPGGPAIETAALSGNPSSFKFPQAIKHEAFDFSFSGIKTAVIYQLNSLKEAGHSIPVCDLAASFQHAVISILIFKAIKACEYTGISNLMLSGGVVANNALRTAFESAARAKKIRLKYPEIRYCTDNAAMIGAAAYFYYRQGPVLETALATPNLSI